MDQKVSDLLAEELARQQNTISLIASENYCSPAVLAASASVFTNKYAEGYPGARYYAGNVVADKLERYCQDLALSLFGLNPEAWGVNVQAYSGSPANLAVYAALLKPGETILALSLAHGAHLSHGHKVSLTGKLYNIVSYSVGQDTGLIDYDEVARLAEEHKPKIIVCGGTALPRQINFARFVEIAKANQALVLADISHIAGLVAAGIHPSPFEAGVDVVMTTTHKTLRGPRAALIYSRAELAAAIDKAIFPGLQGGPHLNTIAAVSQALTEAQSPEFKLYAGAVALNAKKLADGFLARGYDLVSGGTDTHLLLIDLRNKGWSGRQVQDDLEKIGISINMNAVPYDPAKPNEPSGIRLGTPAATTRGMSGPEMEQLAQIMDDFLMKRIGEDAAKSEVAALALAFPIPGYGNI